MSQLVTVFEKIKEDFYKNHVVDDRTSDYKLIFSPFATGFTHDDFLFLDSNSAAKDGDSTRTFYDELLEFSKIANTIPDNQNFWTVSDKPNDYLDYLYKNIILNLKLLDTDKLTAEMLYEHDIYAKALSILTDESKSQYENYFKLYSKLSIEINELQKSITSSNQDVISLQIKMKEDNLKQVLEKWHENGHKIEIESSIINIIKDEFNRFLRKLSNTKSQLDSLRREHPVSGESFYVTYCSPNNLYRANELPWKNVSIYKAEIKEMINRPDLKSYDSIMGKSAMTSLELEEINFELIFVDITRAWFDPSIIDSPCWNINILDKDEINIPAVTEKLIFIRNLDIKLSSSSKKNNNAIKKGNIQNIGPFMVNLSKINKNNTMKLKSVNTALNIERKAVFNVSSKVKTKKKLTNKSADKLVTLKQRQFIKLAPQMRRAQEVPSKNKPKVKIAHQIKLNPHVFTMAQPVKQKPLKTKPPIEILLVCTENNTNKPVPINSAQIFIHDLKKQVNPKITQINSNTLRVVLIPDGIYRFSVDIDGYEYEETQINLSEIKNTSKKITHNIHLDKTDETFQLIGVISRKINPFPNPIKNGKYV